MNGESIELKQDKINLKLYKQIPLKWLKEHCILPFDEDDETVFVAFGRTYEDAIFDKAQQFFKHKPLKSFKAKESQILGILNELELKDKIENLISELKFELKNSQNTNEKTAVSKLFELII